MTKIMLPWCCKPSSWQIHSPRWSTIKSTHPWFHMAATTPTLRWLIAPQASYIFWSCAHTSFWSFFELFAFNSIIIDRRSLLRQLFDNSWYQKALWSQSHCIALADMAPELTSWAQANQEGLSQSQEDRPRGTSESSQGPPWAPGRPSSTIAATQGLCANVLPFPECDLVLAYRILTY